MLLVAGIAVVLYALTYGKLQLDLSKSSPAVTQETSTRIQNERPAVQAPLRVAGNQNNAVEEADDGDWFAEDNPDPAQPVVAAKEENTPAAPAKTVEEANAFFDDVTDADANDMPAEEKAADPFADDVNVNEEPASSAEVALTWNNPNFIKAVRALEGSQKRYDDYLKNRGDKRVLDSVERNCQAAIKVFEGLEGKAPADVDLGSYSKKAYTLLANCQWTKQLL